MINVISFTLLNAHKYGNILEQMLHLRYKGFIVEEKYDVRNYNNTFEFDQYDDPHAHYIAILQEGNMIACSRVRCTNTTYKVANTLKDGSCTQTNITYMAKDIWPDQIPAEYLISSPNHYEVTRVYADSSLSKKNRMYIAMAILCATYGYIISLGGTLGSFVTHTSLVNMTKNLGMKIASACNISIPNFESLQYVSVHLNYSDFISVINNLYSRTSISLHNFAVSHGIVIDETKEKVVA